MLQSENNSNTGELMTDFSNAFLKPVQKTIKINAKMNFDATFMHFTRNVTSEAARKHIQNLKQNPEGLCNSAFHVLDNRTYKNKDFSASTFAIIDGGHRLTALYELACEKKREFLIKMNVYDWEKFKHNRKIVAEFYEIVNTTRPQSKINLYETNSFQSKWVKYFSDHTPFVIKFEQANKQLAWTNMITAYVNAKEMLTTQDITKIRSGGVREDIAKDEYVNGSGFTEFHKFLLWWVPVSEMAKKEYKVGSLYSVPFMTAGFMIWLENPNIKPEDGEKIVRFPRFMKLVKSANKGGAFPETLNTILYAINYKNIKRRCAVLGEVGKDNN